MFQAIRPLALSLSVSQGKGLTRDAARVSALVEAIELHCAERADGRRSGPRPPPRRPVVPVPQAHGAGAPFDPACATRVDARRRPARRRGGAGADGLVSMDARCPPHPICGPTPTALPPATIPEAEVAALCEVIERDSHARWMAASAAARRATAIDPEPSWRAGRWLLARIARAGLRGALWDMSAAHSVAAIPARSSSPGRRRRSACRRRSAPAAIRARTSCCGARCCEAAQTPRGADRRLARRSQRLPTMPIRADSGACWPMPLTISAARPQDHWGEVPDRDLR